MSEPYVGEIRMFAGNFAPRGWALAEGQLLAISSNDALFSLFGTIYGGDGRTTFGLPDLRGRIPIHMGRGPGLTSRPLGQRGGAENVTVTVNQLPAHSHTMRASTGVSDTPNPELNVVARSPTVSHWISDTPTVALNAAAVTSRGGSQSHPNVAPFQCINYIVSLTGIYPSRALMTASVDAPNDATRETTSNV